jgi:hypothetical protein
MPARRSSRTDSRHATKHAEAMERRCARLEALLRSALASRFRARADLARARERLRTAGDDFVTAFEAIDARTDAAVAAGEMRGLLGHDLDVDTLLTVATEHLLARFRPGNVAIWLCNGRGDHGLAAYGHCDVPRPRAESTLGLVGREVCPALPLEPVAQVFERALDMVAAPPPGGGVLPGRRAMLCPLFHRGERMGAVMVLQDESAPFQLNAPETLGAIAAVVGEHIERITRIVVQRCSGWPGGASGAD